MSSAAKSNGCGNRTFRGGLVTLLAADPGTGKSLTAAAVAAAFTTGRPLPGQARTRKPADALIFSAEDDPERVIRPRLEDMGADLTRVHIVSAPLILDEAGFKRLDEEIKHVRAVLVVLDPLTAYLGPYIDTNRANQVRSIMAPLARIAAKHRSAVLAVMHLSKAVRERPIYRALGSIDFIAAARSAIFIEVDPRDEEARLVFHVKHNLSAEGPTLRFRFDGQSFAWDGTSPLRAHDVFGEPPSADERSALDDAEDFLRQTLAQGPILSEQVYEQAEKQHIAPRTLQRAKARLGVISTKRGADWFWALP